MTLDCGCGEGYGTAWLKKQGINIIGLDYSQQAVNVTHLQSSKIEVIMGDVNSLPIKPNSFESIISFELIEHLEDSTSYLSNICQTLKATGIFIGSTPIKKENRYKNGKPKNIFHKREYSIDEIKTLLKKYFGSVQLFGQKFPSKIEIIFFSQIYKLGILRDQHTYYPIHEIVTPKDDKCLWIARQPKKKVKEANVVHVVDE